jgi:LysM repeat protein
LGVLLLQAHQGLVGSTAAAAQSDMATLLLQVVNEVRAEHGLPPFQWNTALAAAAQNQANFNAANALYGHTGEGGSRPLGRANDAGYMGYVVENVVGGWELTPRQGVTWWVNSPVHYNTLITTRYVEAGTGHAINGRQHHYTLVVGRTSDSDPNAPSGVSPQSQAPAIVIPIVLSEPREDGSILHEVKQGQTLWAIAARYSIRLEELRLYNNLPDTELLLPGDELIIRLAEGQDPPPTPTPPLTHVVQQGETLWTIAARYRLALADILWFNSLSEETVLHPGDELTIRLAEGQLPPATSTPLSTHIVRTGETIWGIAAIYGLTVDELLTINELKSGDVLQPADVLLLRPEVRPSPVGQADLVETSSAATDPLGDSVGGPESTATAPSPVGAAATAHLDLDQATLAVTITSAGSVEPLPVTVGSGRTVANLALIAGIAFTLLAAVLAIAVYRSR